MKRYKKIAVYIILITVLMLIIYYSKQAQQNTNISLNDKTLSYVTKTETSVKKKYFGVNIAGPEFQQAMYADKQYTGYQYFNSKGLTLIRIPFKWERLQPLLQRNLDNNQLSSYISMIVSAQNAGENIIIEPHNYGRYNNNPLTSNDSENFSDLWRKLAQKFNKGYPGIWGYELMNEPHDTPGDCQTWKILSQSAINTIRHEDASHYILVPGYSWQGASDWQSKSDCLKDLRDPSNKLIYSAHEYFDEDKSGTYQSSCTNPNIGAERAKPFLDWLAINNKVGIFTEYGIPQSQCWQETLDIFMQYIYNNPNIIGGTYWAAGPAWGNYPLSVEQENKIDKSQMLILEKYPTTK